MDDMCTDNRFELIERFKKKLIESTNIETSPEEMKAIDNLLFRFWQMGWLDIIDRMSLVKESAKTLMHSVGNSVSAKAFRNAGRFIQNAIDGEAPEFEKIPSAQPEPHWIPVSGGLPEADGRYLATRGLNACGTMWNRVYIINYSDLMGLKSERIWWEGNVGKSDFERIDDVLAWMPLPEPYRDGGD